MKSRPPASRNTVMNVNMNACSAAAETDPPVPAETPVPDGGAETDPPAAS